MMPTLIPDLSNLSEDDLCCCLCYIDSVLHKKTVPFSLSPEEREEYKKREAALLVEKQRRKRELQETRARIARIDWDCLGLGKRTDTWIANWVGCSVGKVQRERVRRGIPRFCRRVKD